MDSLEPIKRKIYEIRGRRVMLDSDLAEMYQVETKNLKRAVRANIKRFPDDFMFELTKEEYDSLRCKKITLNDENDALRCKNFTSNKRGGNRYLPFVFICQDCPVIHVVWYFGEFDEKITESAL